MAPALTQLLCLFARYLSKSRHNRFRLQDLAQFHHSRLFPLSPNTGALTHSINSVSPIMPLPRPMMQDSSSARYSTLFPWDEF